MKKPKKKRANPYKIGMRVEDGRAKEYEELGALVWCPPKARMFAAPKHRTQDIFGCFDALIHFPGHKPLLVQWKSNRIPKKELNRIKRVVRRRRLKEGFNCRVEIKKNIKAGGFKWETIEL